VLLLWDSLQVRTLLALARPRTRRRAVESAQALRLALNFGLFALSFALLGFDHFLQAAALGFVSFLALGAVLVGYAFLGFGLGAETGGFGVEGPLGAGIGHWWWAGLGF
jgi:hypothetical protein